MASLQECIERARTIAESRGIDPFKSPIIDAGMGAEALFPHILRHLLGKSAVSDVLSSTADWTINLTDDPNLDGIGVGDFPDQILTEFLDRSYLPLYPRATFTSFADLNRPRYDNLLNYYAVRNTKFYLSGFDRFMDDFVTINAPSMPLMPADASDDLPLSSNIIDDGVAYLAGCLTGEIKLETILVGD